MTRGAASVLAVAAAACGGCHRGAPGGGDGGAPNGGAAAANAAANRADGAADLSRPERPEPGLSPRCGVPSEAPPPHAVGIRLHNSGPRRVYLRQDCWLQLALSSCAADYEDALRIRQPCEYCRCSTCKTGCAVCGDCAPPAGIPVAPGASQLDRWDGNVISVRGGDCPTSECWEATPAATAWYRVQVPVYASAEHAAAGTPVLHTSAVDFPLPAPGGVVEVDLAR